MLCSPFKKHDEWLTAELEVLNDKFLDWPIESKTRTHHGPVGSGRRTARRRGGAGLSRTGRRWVDPARGQPSLLPSSESRTLSWTSLRKHEQSNSYLKPTEGQNPRLTSGWPAVYLRFIRGWSAGRKALFVPGCWPVYRRLFVSVNPFHARNVREWSLHIFLLS